METNKALEWAKKNVIPLLIVGGLAAVLLGGFMIKVSIVNARNDREVSLSATYLDTQNQLSSCLSKSTQAANITKAEAKVMKEALTEALKARYEGGAVDPSSGKLFSAIVEQYPDLKPFQSAFKDAFVVMIGCREDFKNAQTQLISEVKSYNKWRVGSQMTRWFADAPSSNLEADIGDGNPVTGKQALAKIKQIIRTPDTVKAYTTGQLDEKDPFEEDGGN